MRLIDVDELKGKAFADHDDGEHFVYCQDIDEAPTVDAVPVIRCRECIYFCPEDAWDRCINRNGLFNPVESYFCSYGKRKEKNNA